VTKTVGVVMGLTVSGDSIKASLSSGATAEAGGVRGRSGASGAFLFLDLRGKMEPVQPFDLPFFFLLFLLDFDLALVSSVTSTADSEPCSEEEPAEVARGLEPDELELDGRALTGELVAKASSPKKDQRLGVFEGLGVGGATLEASGISKSAGIEFRRLGDAADMPG
jgi:hypothetical protein